MQVVPIAGFSRLGVQLIGERDCRGRVSDASRTVMEGRVNIHFSLEGCPLGYILLGAGPES